MSDFIRPILSFNTVDRFIIRSQIFKAVQVSAKGFTGSLLDIGCGSMPYREFIKSNSEISEYHGVDLFESLNYGEGIRPDYLWDGRHLPISNHSYDVCISTEVLEHCFDPQLLLKEAFRVLKPGGKFFFTVPFLWNLHEVPNDHYRYTPFSLRRHLQDTGFGKIEVYATGGWHLAFAQMIGLWIKRSPMRKSYRYVLFYMLRPFLNFLISKGLKETISFSEGQMITGLYGIAYKS